MDRVDIVIEDPIEHKKKLDQINFTHYPSVTRRIRMWGKHPKELTRPGVDKVKPKVWFKYSL